MIYRQANATMPIITGTNNNEMIGTGKEPLRWYNTSQGLWPGSSLSLAAQITTGNTTNATGAISTSGNNFVPVNLKTDFSSSQTANMCIKF